MAPQAAQAEAAARAADLRGAEQRCAAAEAALRRERSQKGSAFQLQQVLSLAKHPLRGYSACSSIASRRVAARLVGLHSLSVRQLPLVSALSKSCNTLSNMLWIVMHMRWTVHHG